jgi:hypothetical protein
VKYRIRYLHDTFYAEWKNKIFWKNCFWWGVGIAMKTTYSSFEEAKEAINKHKKEIKKRNIINSNNKIVYYEEINPLEQKCDINNIVLSEEAKKLKNFNDNIKKAMEYM